MKQLEAKRVGQDTKDRRSHTLNQYDSSERNRSSNKFTWIVINSLLPLPLDLSIHLRQETQPALVFRVQRRIVRHQLFDTEDVGINSVPVVDSIDRHVDGKRPDREVQHRPVLINRSKEA